jgi:hypothetical protein
MVVLSIVQVATSFSSPVAIYQLLKYGPHNLRNSELTLYFQLRRNKR